MAASLIAEARYHRFRIILVRAGLLPPNPYHEIKVRYLTLQSIPFLNICATVTTLGNFFFHSMAMWRLLPSILLTDGFPAVWCVYPRVLSCFRPFACIQPTVWRLPSKYFAKHTECMSGSSQHVRHKASGYTAVRTLRAWNVSRAYARVVEAR